MNEALRHEIVQRHQAGASIRSIAKGLGISRGAVARVLARLQAQREGRAAPLAGPRPRGSLIDPFESILKELLAKYPNLTVERALQELRQRGFAGGYTVVRQRVRLLRPPPARAAVPRFETGPGQQAQMDFGVYDVDFTREGRRRVYLFSYLLGYSRRQYLRWVESMDLRTTLREHVQDSIIWAASPVSASTTTSRRWSCGTMPTVRCTTRSSSPLPRTTASARKPAVCAVHRQKENANASFIMSKPACSMAGPSTRWNISTR
jgi:transposase